MNRHAFLEIKILWVECKFRELSSKPHEFRPLTCVLFEMYNPSK